MDSALVNVFDTAKADTMVIFEDAIRAVTSEKEVALDCVRLLEVEKQKTETRLLSLENELHETHLNLDALNHVNAGLQERARTGEFPTRKQYQRCMLAPAPTRVTTITTFAFLSRGKPPQRE